MKRIKRILFCIFISFIFVFNAKALSKSDYIDINTKGSLIAGDLEFSGLTFKDYSNTSTQAIGIVGTLNNKSTDIKFDTEVDYYDANKNLLFTSNNTKSGFSGKSDFSHMENLYVLNGPSVSEIKYYTLSVNVLGNIVKNDYSPSKIEDYKNLGYVIDKYNIDMKVNEDGSFDITETITAYFNEERHGIIRNIPTRNSVIRLDGTSYTNKARVTDVYVNENYSTSKENDYFNIKIGSASTTITGAKEYQITYKYRLSNDKNKGYDELYFNLIGDKWDTAIGNVTFTITMPKEFDSSKLGFSKGIYGSVENENINYSVDGNVIKGYYEGVLNSHEALTVRCELEEGYFIKKTIKLDLKQLLVFIIPIAFAILAIYLWNKYGKDDLVVETVEFYPPNGMNSLDLAYAYKGSSDDKDIVSLLIYLANKGYIKITEVEKKSVFGKKSFEITKLRDYDSNIREEELFMEGLFEKKNTVTKSDLENKFYKTLNKIKMHIMNSDKKYKLFEKSASKKIFPLILMTIAIYCLITIPPLLEYGSDTIMFAVFGTMLSFSFIFIALFGNFPLYVNNIEVKSKVGKFLVRIFATIFGLVFAIPMWVTMVLPAIIDYPIYIVEYVVGFISSMIVMICLIYMPKRTPYGNNILGRIRGFKRFLETAEKDKLEALVEENPTYFYDILPYTYVLGISNKWIKKFESIAIQPPTWYEGYDAFDYYMFSTFINDTISSAERVMTSVPQSSGGSGGFSSGSSGGGFSGGGSGGGGGSSW